MITNKQNRFQSGQELCGWRTILGYRVSILGLCLCLLFPLSGKAFNLFNPKGLGMSLVMTHQDDNQIGGSGIGSGFCFYLKYQSPSNTYLNIGSGFFTMTDDVLKMDHYQTTIFPSLEIQYGVYLSQSRIWHPNLYCGINSYAAFDKFKYSTTKTNISERFLQMCGFLGGGIEIQPNYLYSIHINADYRYVFWASEHNGRQFVVMKIGFLFYQ